MFGYEMCVCMRSWPQQLSEKSEKKPACVDQLSKDTQQQHRQHLKHMHIELT